MARPPRSQRPRVNKPSPLQQEISNRPLSQFPDVNQPSAENGLGRDPMFWKRFSVAMHDAEKAETESTTRGSRSNSGSSADTVSRAKYAESDGWLQQQAKDRRRCRVICMSITLIIALLLVVGVVCGLYFTKIKRG